MPFVKGQKRPPRHAAKAAAANIRTPTPALKFSDDEDDVDQEASRPETPNDADDNDNAAQDTDNGGSADGSPVVQPFPRKKRLGRPPKGRATDWGGEGGDDASEGGTPGRRRRGRPSVGGFRGRPRHVQATSSRVPIDKEGNMADVVDDEIDLPEDPAGETKVNKDGELQGGREYRVRTFRIPGRGNRLYMLSTEPARCTGFRDSYLFFTKHMQLHKVILEDHEKHSLIDAGVLLHSYKGRSIGVVTARSVFREFGAQIVVGGKWVVDDYYIEKSKEAGHIEGELADPYDRLPAPGEEYNRNRYVAWHGASSVYHTNVPSVPMINSKIAGKKKVTITSANWQFEHARAASRFNSSIAAIRKANSNGIYDPHTNAMLYPMITQPTHARWEQVVDEEEEDEEDSPPAKRRRLVNGAANGDTNNHLQTAAHQVPTRFGDVPRVVSRNFLVADVHLTAPSVPGNYLPGPDGDAMDVGGNGLALVPDDVLAELPPECRRAFVKARQREQAWKSQWGDERRDGSRAELKIGFNGFPV